MEVGKRSEADLRAGPLPADPEWRVALWRWLGFALALHLLAAWFSEGFYQHDEHWQILEFMTCHLGRTPCGELPWEYPAQMRPWLQPLLYAQFARLFMQFGIDDPSAWATGFRFVSSGIGWFSLVALALCLPRWIESAWLRRWALIGLSCLWYLPYLHARTSAENLSGSCLALAIAALTLLRGRYTRVIAAGCLLGLAFEFRYQLGFCIAGLGLWGLAIEGWRAPRALAFGGAVLGVIALGSALDSFAYGEWVFAPWNYIQQNVIEGRMHGFGREHPWWYYFNRVGTVLAPLSVVLVSLVCTAWVRCWRSPLVWVTAAFVLGHTLTTHKSMRFLFSIAPLVPVLAAMALDGWRPRGIALSPARFRHPLLALLVVACVLVDGVALARLSLFPPANATGIYASVRRAEPKIRELYWVKHHPYGRDLVMGYYQPEWLTPVEIPSLAAFEARLDASDTPLHLFDTHGTLPRKTLRDRCDVLYASHPAWFRRSRIVRALDGRIRARLLYRCTP